MRVGKIVLRTIGWALTVGIAFLGLVYAPWMFDRNLRSLKDPHEGQVMVATIIWLFIFVLFTMWSFRRLMKDKTMMLLTIWTFSLLIMIASYAQWLDHLATIKTWDGQCDFAGPVKMANSSQFGVAIDCNKIGSTIDYGRVLRASIGKTPQYIHCMRFANGKFQCDAD